jgi:hypothetical protein
MRVVVEEHGRNQELEVVGQQGAQGNADVCLEELDRSPQRRGRGRPQGVHVLDLPDLLSRASGHVAPVDGEHGAKGELSAQGTEARVQLLAQFVEHRRFAAAQGIEDVVGLQGLAAVVHPAIDLAHGPAVLGSHLVDGHGVLADRCAEPLRQSVVLRVAALGLVLVQPSVQLRAVRGDVDRQPGPLEVVCRRPPNDAPRLQVQEDREGALAALRDWRRVEHGGRQRRDSLLAVDHPQCIGLGLAHDPQIAELKPGFGCSALPQEERADGVPLPKRVEELAHMPAFPREAPLEGRNTHPSAPHPGQQVDDAKGSSLRALSQLVVGGHGLDSSPRALDRSHHGDRQRSCEGGGPEGRECDRPPTERVVS